ncbi:MAG: 4-hydroxy-3-methylbut-2-enyl diphosphate reductase [Armatimonadetes bacterium]|nr:4-hydroxy-3-methylbut-2-enyl diphosphate reductase [Armatimonadota bacterium]
MRVLVAEHHGMCFGVRDAIALARSLPTPDTVTVYGELVHNEQVNASLAARGLAISSEAGRTIPDTPAVLVTAHGISDLERGRLLASGKRIVDATCPLVRRVHLIAHRLRDQGWFVVVLGQAGHVEVRGIVEDLWRWAVVGSIDDARRWDADRIAVICQTTTPPEQAELLGAAVARANPHAEIRFVDTICAPTRERQQALRSLLGVVDALVVVVGRHSNNTRKLAATAAARGIPCTHVQTAAELDARWCAQFGTVGLTAGTSTPDETIRAVHERLIRIGQEVA